MRFFVPLLLLITSHAFANTQEILNFSVEDGPARYATLIDELRCMVCQNQNLADSNAELAKDLKGVVFEMIEDGKSDDQIVDFMVDRYGEKVMYRPPVNPSTYLLWFGPFLLAIIGLILLIRQIRRPAADSADEATLSDEEHRRAAALLAGDNEEKDS